jgi:biotin operon repressor
MIGCSRETVSRAMKLLQDSGYASVVDRGLAIEHRAIRRYHLPSLQSLTPPDDALA